MFEAIRAYGDGTKSCLFSPDDHYRRLLDNEAWLQMQPRWSAAELAAPTVELLRRNRFYDDRYVRPILHKSAQTVGAGAVTIRLAGWHRDLVTGAVPPVEPDWLVPVTWAVGPRRGICYARAHTPRSLGGKA